MLSLRIAARFLRTSPVQSTLIVCGIAVGIAVQLFVGTLMAGADPLGQPAELLRGVPFSASLLLILACAWWQSLPGLLYDHRGAAAVGHFACVGAGLVLIAAPGPWSGRAVGTFLGVWLSYFLLTYAFGAAGVFLSMFVVKGGALVGYAIGIPMILALLAFLETVGSELLRALSRLSPFRYLGYARILETASVDVPFVCITAAISAALLALSIVLYRKREFAV